MTSPFSQWTFYGDAGVPLWLVVLGLAVLLGLLLRWLRAEMASRRKPLARWLPATLVPLCLLLAWLAYNPVIVKTRTWHESKGVTAVLDRSLSMSLPLSPANLTARLDLLAIIGKPDLDNRTRAGASLAEQMDGVGEQLARQLAAVEELAAHAAQGIPPGPQQEAKGVEYGKWRAKADAAFAGGADALTEQLPMLPDALPAADSPLVQALETARTLFARLPETLTAEAGAELRSLSTVVAKLVPLLWSAQEALDQRWFEKHAAALETAFEALNNTTRYELLRATARVLPAGVTRLLDSAEAEESDLYQMCEQAFADDQGQEAGHVVLFSDGAHNGSSSDHILERLREAGCGFTAVSIPQSAVSGVDPALQRWQAAPLVRAEQEATLSVTVRLPARMSRAPTLRLVLDEQILAQRSLENAPEGISSHQLVYPAPAPGRYLLKLELVAAEDAVPQNNLAYFVQETISKPPKLLLIGDTPTWDTEYLGVAAIRSALELDQVYHVGESPKRGSFSGSVPKTAEQWQRNSAVVLTGSLLADFSDEDSAALHELVVGGGTLLLFGTPQGGYADRLARTFGWTGASPAATGALRLRPENAHLPLVAVGVDAAVSARRIAALPPLPTATDHATRAVPAQNLVLVETEEGVPLVSLGFYGRGKIICWGLMDLYRLRRPGSRDTVDRLLDNLLAELSLPLLPKQSRDEVALYPPLPEADRKLFVVQWGEQLAPVAVDGQEPLVFVRGQGNALASFTPAAGKHRLSAGNWTGDFQAVRNPGQELLDPALDPAMLQQMAERAGGRQLTAAAARTYLPTIDPGTRTLTESAIYRPGRHWLVLVLLLVVFTLHWVLRKLSGLVL